MRDFTHITVLLDRSGSMSEVKSDVIGGFNQFVEEQKKAGENAALTLVQFDSQSIDVVYDSLLIGEVQPLSEQSFIPRGSTPLLDALGQSIVKAGERLSAIPEASRPDKVVFVIQTDGLENASREYTKSQIREMTERQERDYKWQFVYLGANQDAFKEAHMMGIPTANAATYAPTSRAVRASYAAASQNLRAYRATGNPRELGFSSEQLKKLRDEEESAKHA